LQQIQLHALSLRSLDMLFPNAVAYRSWLDETGAPLTVQKELMRHASIQTTMNIYGKAMTDTKRQAHRKVVEMVLKSNKTEEGNGKKKPIAGLGS
jgi:integrase